MGSPCSLGFYLVFWLFKLAACGVTLFWALAGQMWGHLVLGLGWTNVGSPCSGPWLDKWLHVGSPCSLGFYYLVFWLFKLAACGVTLFWALAGQMAACGVTLFWTNVGSPCSGPWLDKWLHVGSPCSGPWLDKWLHVGSPCSLGFYLVFWLFKLAACGGHLVLGLGWTNVGSPCSGPWLDKCGVTLFWALAGQMAACGVTLFFRLLLLSILAVQTGCMWGHLVLGLGWTNVGSPCSLGFYYLVFWLFKLAACGVTLFWALAGQMAACGVTLFWALAGQMWGHLVL